jgi:hypothetical protein
LHADTYDDFAPTLQHGRAARSHRPQSRCYTRPRRQLRVDGIAWKAASRQQRDARQPYATAARCDGSTTRRLRGCDGYEAAQAMRCRRRTGLAHGPRSSFRAASSFLALQPRSESDTRSEVHNPEKEMMANARTHARTHTSKNRTPINHVELLKVCSQVCLDSSLRSYIVSSLIRLSSELIRSDHSSVQNTPWRLEHMGPDVRRGRCSLSEGREGGASESLQYVCTVKTVCKS